MSYIVTNKFEDILQLRARLYILREYAALPDVHHRVILLHEQGVLVIHIHHRRWFSLLLLLVLQPSQFPLLFVQFLFSLLILYIRTINVEKFIYVKTYYSNTREINEVELWANSSKNGSLYNFFSSFSSKRFPL